MGSPVGVDSFGNYGVSSVDTGGQDFAAWAEQERAGQAAEEEARLNTYMYTSDNKYRRRAGGGPVERIDPNTGQWASWNTGGNSEPSHTAVWMSVASAADYKRDLLGKKLGDVLTADQLNGNNAGLTDYLKTLSFGPVQNSSYGINIDGPGTWSNDVLTHGTGWERNAIPLLDADGNIGMYWTPGSTLNPTVFGDAKASETFNANPAYAASIKSGYGGTMPIYGGGYFIPPTASDKLDSVVGNAMTGRTYNNPQPKSGLGGLGALGTIAGLAGAAFGVPALGMLGKGLSLANAIESGNPLGIISGVSGLAGFNPFGSAGDAVAGVDPSEFGMGASMGWNDLPTSAFDTGAMADAFSNIPGATTMGDAVSSYDPSEFGMGADMGWNTLPTSDLLSIDPSEFGMGADMGWSNIVDSAADVIDPSEWGMGADMGWNGMPAAGGVDMSNPSEWGMGATSSGIGATAPSSSWWNTLKGLGDTAKGVLDAAKPYAGLIGAGAGAAAAAVGNKSGSTPAGQTTTTTVPWAAQQPYLLDLFAKAKAAQQGTVGLSPLQQGAVANATTMLNNPLTGPAQGLIGQAIGGQLKNPYSGTGNPYLEDTINKANEDVNRAMMPALAQASRASGSFGNSGVAETYGRAMSDQFAKNATGLRFQDYTQQQNLAENDINRRLTAAYNVPTFNANTLATNQNLYNLGGLSKNDPFDSLGKYGSLIGGSYGNAVSQPYFQNNMAGLLGGALAGAQLFPSLFKQG